MACDASDARWRDGVFAISDCTVTRRSHVHMSTYSPDRMHSCGLGNLRGAVRE